MSSSCRHTFCLTLIALLPLTATADQSKSASSESLRNDQLAVSGRYDRFERLLSQMADILGHEDPERAELLRRAISKGREQAISSQLNQIAGDLGKNDLGKALEQQEQVIESLTVLLQLLQSEDRRSELEKERERLNRLLKDVSDTLSQQRSARARTRNSNAPSSSARSQQKALERADRILDDIKNSDDSKADETETESSDSEADESDSEAGKETESADENSDNNSSDNNSEGDSSSDPSKSQDGDQPADSGDGKQPSSESESQSSSDSESQNSGSNESPPEDRQTPGREQISNARRFMQEALEQLQQQLREKALDRQDSAVEELQKAVEELRKRLLQLREEEKEMVLASLEARFQRMLAAETQIYDETVDLDATPVDDWLDTMFARSREVAQQQAELQVECEQTLGLLNEDGTSVAIVLSVEDIAQDMKTVAGRLRASKAGSLTQTLETDIVEALQELIEATQREMQEMKSEERQQQQQAPADQQQKPALVQLIAEIKVLRSLQLRVNRRTLRIDGLMAEADDDERSDLIGQLEELTTRQQRLVESAAELGRRMDR